MRDVPSLIVHSLWHGIWIAATSSPLTALVAILATLGALTGFVRAVIHSGHDRDPVRRFSRSEKAAILTRAGHRCEHHHLLLGRCRTTDQLEADHIHPWSRGGQTALANGQALCKQHNRAKRATVPYGWQLRALERRRTTYFPEGLSGAVTMHMPRRPTGRRRAARGEQSHSAT